MLLAENIKLPAPCRNLSSPWVGPYLVRSVEGLNVELELPPTWQIHPVFHQSLLKPYSGDPPDDRRPEPEVTAGGEEELVVEATRASKIDPELGTLCQVRWRGCPETDNTWEPASRLQGAGGLVYNLTHRRQSRRRRRWSFSCLWGRSLPTLGAPGVRVPADARARARSRLRRGRHPGRVGAGIGSTPRGGRHVWRWRTGWGGAAGAGAWRQVGAPFGRL